MNDLADSQLTTSRRTLLQAEPPLAGSTDEIAASIVTHEEVDSPEALLGALQEGVAHVVVVNHLDLTSLPLVPDGNTSNISNASLVPDRTKSIRGNCPQTPTVQGLPLHPRTTSNQCVLRTQDSFLEVPPSSEPAEEPQRLWLDNLYIFNSPSDLSQGPPSTPPTMLTVSMGSELWMTNMALLGAKEQFGDSAESSEPANISRGMHVLPGAAVYARNVTMAFHEWDGAAAAQLDTSSTFAAVDSVISDCHGTSVINAGPSLARSAEESSSPAAADSAVQSFRIPEAPGPEAPMPATALPAAAAEPAAADDMAPAAASNATAAPISSPGNATEDSTSTSPPAASDVDDDPDSAQEPEETTAGGSAVGGDTAEEGDDEAAPDADSEDDEDRVRRDRPEEDRPPRQLSSPSFIEEPQQQTRRLMDSADPEPATWVWLQNVELTRNEVMPADPGGETPQIRSTGDGLARVLSDPPHLVLEETTGATVDPQPLSQDSFSAAGFLSEERAWFQSTQSEASEVTGVPVISSQGRGDSVSAFQSGDDLDLMAEVPTRNTRGHRTHTPVMIPGLMAGSVVLVVVMVMVWRWSRALRRKNKPSSLKKTFHGPLMPQSSARMPKLLKHVSRSTNNSMLPAGSPLAAPTLARNSFPFPNATSMMEENASLGPMTFPSAIATKNGSFTTSRTDAQATSEANVVNTPPSARNQQSRFGMFPSTTPFNGSPSHGNHSRRSSLSNLHTENPAVRPSGLGLGADTCTSASPKAPLSPKSPESAKSVYDTGAADMAADMNEDAVRSGMPVLEEPPSAVETTPVEVGSMRTKTWSKRQLFNSASKILSSRRSTLDSHNASLEQLEDALTQMSRFSEPLLEVYHVLPATQRKRSASGHSVAQAVRRNADGAEFVAKFCLNREIFLREDALRQHPVFFKLLPPTREREANGAARLRGPNGCVFPPFAIVDSGVSLKDWCTLESRSYSQRLQALCAIAEELSVLHDAGLAHCGLHPRNVLWLPMGAKWNLVDFGHAVQLGRTASPVHVDRPYTPPEATVATESAQEQLLIKASFDIWALGAIAHEVLTGTPVATPLALRDSGNNNRLAHLEDGADPLGLDAACAAASGAAAGCDNHQLLGPLAPTVYSCMSSEPSARPSASAVLSAWQGILSHMSFSS